MIYTIELKTKNFRDKIKNKKHPPLIFFAQKRKILRENLSTVPLKIGQYFFHSVYK